MIATLLNIALLAPAPVTEAPTRPLRTLQVDPLTTALGYVHVQIEHVLGDHFSVYLGPHLRLFSAPFAEEKEDFTGFGAEVGLRYYFSGTAPEGWWGLVRGVTAQASTDDETAFAGYGSLLGGYTAIFDDVFVLSGGAGVQYIEYQVAGLGPKGIFPALHTALGVAF